MGIRAKLGFLIGCLLQLLALSPTGQATPVPSATVTTGTGSVTTTTLLPEPPIPTNPDDLPAFFWRSKPALMAEMKESRKLVFSAKTNPATGDQLALMDLVAGGYVHVSLSYAWNHIREYEKLPQIDDHFQSATYDAKTQELELSLAALGYHQELTLHLREEPEVSHPAAGAVGATAPSHRIFWVCTHGAFRGMTGLIEVTDRGRQTTEISMTARSRSAKLPLPKVLMGFGLELVGQHTAGAIRKFLETEYQAKD